MLKCFVTWHMLVKGFSASITTPLVTKPIGKAISTIRHIRRKKRILYPLITCITIPPLAAIPFLTNPYGSYPTQYPSGPLTYYDQYGNFPVTIPTTFTPDITLPLPPTQIPEPNSFLILFFPIFLTLLIIKIRRNL